MRYLTLAADYGELSLRDEQAGALDVVNLDVPRDLIDDLIAWNARYQPIVPLDFEERQAPPAAALIDELDRAGIDLSERLVRAIGDDVKIKYYSEGRLRHLP